MKKPMNSKEHTMKMPVENNKDMKKMPMKGKPYLKLLIMIGLSFISMYVLMYAMVDKFANVIPNINQFFMAGLMTIPMIIIEILLMGSMYLNKKLNTLIISISSVANDCILSVHKAADWVSDRQFLLLMIPHHASAILMCEKANLQDPEIKALCTSIISGQQEEIDQMKAKLGE